MKEERRVLWEIDVRQDLSLVDFRLLRRPLVLHFMLKSFQSKKAILGSFSRAMNRDFRAPTALLPDPEIL